MKPYIPLLALAISSPANALTIDLMEHPFGNLTVYNPSDNYATLYFSGSGLMSYPTDPYARSVYYITVSGGTPGLGGMTICNVIGFYHDPCQMTAPSSGTGWISLDPGTTELSYSGHMAYSPVSVLLGASLTIDDRWFRSPEYVGEFTPTPIPGAVWLFGTILAAVMGRGIFRRASDAAWAN